MISVDSTDVDAEGIHLSILQDACVLLSCRCCGQTAIEYAR